ncbi:hypothetical protein AB0885_41925, partial [Streptomyces sp. NPDC005534]
AGDPRHHRPLPPGGGRHATVEAVVGDLDGETHLAVVVDDDPGTDLRRAQGRFLYFKPDEVVPLRDELQDGKGVAP